MNNNSNNKKITPIGVIVVAIAAAVIGLPLIGNFLVNLHVIYYIIVAVACVWVGFTLNKKHEIENPRFWTYDNLSTKIAVGIMAFAGLDVVILGSSTQPTGTVVAVLICLFFVVQMAAIVWWSWQKPTGKFDKEFLYYGALLLHAVLVYTARFYWITHSTADAVDGNEWAIMWSFGGSIIAAMAWFIPAIAIIVFVFRWFHEAYSNHIKIVVCGIAVAVFVVLLCSLKWSLLGTGKGTASAGEGNTENPEVTSVEDPNPSAGASTEEPEEEEVVNPIPDAEEVNKIADPDFDEELLNAALEEKGLVDNKVKTEYLPHSKGRLYDDAVAIGFADDDEEDEAFKALLEEIKTNPVLEANVMIALENSKFFKDYVFLNDYFKEYFDEQNHLLMTRQFDQKTGILKRERNIKTLMALIVLSEKNKVEIIEGRDTEKVVRLDRTEYLTGSGFNLDGCKVELQTYHEAKENQKFLVVEYAKKNGEKCRLYFNWYDKAFVILKENKPTSTPPPSTTPSPSPSPTEKPKDKIKPTDKPKQKITTTPSPSPKPTDKPTGKITPDPTPTATPSPTAPPPTATITPTATPTPTVTVPPKDGTKGTQGNIVNPPKDSEDPIRDNTSDPSGTSKKEPEYTSTDDKNIPEYKQEMENNKPEVTLSPTPEVTQTQDCETGEKKQIEGMVDEGGHDIGEVPIEYGTPQDDLSTTDGKPLVNDAGSPGGYVGPPQD